MSTEPDAEDRRRLTALADDAQRERLFIERPDLATAETVGWLCSKVARQVIVDLERAQRLAETAVWLGKHLEDPGSHALARRAVANVKMFARDYQAAAEIYTPVVEEFERLGDAKEAAITRSSAIACLSHLGRYELALEYAASARTSFRRAGDTLRLARLENNVAHLLSRRDRFTEALNHYRRARSLLRQVGAPADLATVLRNIAVCYQELNDLERSLEAYKEARAYCDEHGQTRMGLELEYNVAYFYYLRGEYARAISAFEAARRSCEEAGDQHHKALCDLDQAEIFLELNLVSDAALLAERSIDGFGALGMNYEVAKALAFAALAAERLGQPERSATLLARARRVFAKEDNRVWTAMIDLYQAFASYAADRPREAGELAATALASFERSGIPSRTALCEVLLARLALERGDLTRARSLSARATQRAATVGRPILDLQTQLISGQVDEAAGDREAAMAAYTRAEAALERMRGQLATDELKIAFGDDKQAVYQGLVAITLEEQGEDAARRAFKYAEKAKSRGLADLLAFGAGELRPVRDGFEDLAAKVRELREELNWLYRQLDAEELKGNERSMETVVRLLADCRHREERLLRHQRRLLSADAELGSLQGAAVSDASAVAEVLPDGAALIEYYVVRDLVYAFVLDRGRLSVRPVALLSDLREAQIQLGFQLEKFRLGPDYVARFGQFLEESTRTLLCQLYDELLAPVLDGLEADHLVVVPHDLLHHLPFHAFHDGERYLVDRFVVSYAPSATVLRLCSLRQPGSADHSLVLGVPDKRAPMITEEVKMVAERLPEAHLLVGKEATPDALARWGANCRILHLATHGLYRKDNPMFSAIQMGDSRLSLMDLYGMRLEAELAVLSGCGTGMSSVRGADELVGLTRGLLHAGARAVVATLWDVNDESTAQFMDSFYRDLLATEQPAAALRTAQLELRERYPHPYYWAPFLLVGRPYPTPPSAS